MNDRAWTPSAGRAPCEMVLRPVAAQLPKLRGRLQDRSFAAGACAIWVALALVLVGCGPVAPPKTRAKKPAAAPGAQQAERLPKEVNSRGIAAHWQEQLPDGTVRRVMDIDAATGLLDARTQSGTLNEARGVLYRDDKPRARFEAPRVKADREKDTVVALGGVTVTSIEPPGAVVKADRVTWRQRRDEVVAEGNVQMTYQPPGAAAPVGFGHAPRITFNTELDRYHIP